MKNKEKDNQCDKMGLEEKEKVDEFVALTMRVYEEPGMTRPEAVEGRWDTLWQPLLMRLRRRGMK